MRRTARTRVLSGVLLFVAVQAGLNVAIRHDVVPVRDPVYAAKFDALAQWPAYFGEAAVPRVLALGSSRTQLAVDAERLERALPIHAFNFGTPAGGPMTSNLYLRRLFDAGLRADVVLIEVHPCFTGMLPFESCWLHEYRLRDGEAATLARFGHTVNEPAHLGWRGYFTASYSYRMPFLNRYAVRWLPSPYGLATEGGDAHGFTRGHTVSGPQRAKYLAMAREQYEPVFHDYRGGGPGQEAVRDTIRLCRAHGVRPIVLVSAESSEFRAWYGAGNVAIAEFVRSFDCEVIDAREWLADDDFADGHHPTPAGAERFTDQLAARLRGRLRCP